MRFVLLAALLTFAAFGPAISAEKDRSPPTTFAVVKTGKERLSDKASDEQRVDDCKVPIGRRTRDRPVSCPWDVRS